MSISYEDVYTPVSTIPVFAGLTPVSVTSLVGLVPTSVLCIYFTQWAYNILGASKYVTGISSPTCNGNDCTAVFLPGGVETARLQTGNLNLTLLNGTVVQDFSSILINHAPGYQLEFFPVPSGYSFPPSDCALYGQERDDSLQLCVSSQNSTILAGYYSCKRNQLTGIGWSICPTSLFRTGTCYTNKTWSYRLDQSTSMNVFKRYSTVAYDATNLSILSVESVTAPQVVTIDPQEFRTIFSTVFTPTTNLTSDDTEMTTGLLFQIGWLLRLYQDDFADNDFIPLNFLRGLLTVPIQFTVTALQYVNSTVSAIDPQSNTYALPADLKTTASAARSTYRAISTKPWTVYTFIAVVIVLLLCGNILFALVWTKPPLAAVPIISSFSEIDATSKSGRLLTQQPFQDYCSALRQAGLGNACSADIVQGVRRKNIRVVEINAAGPPDETFFLLAVVDGMEAEME